MSCLGRDCARSAHKRIGTFFEGTLFFFRGWFCASDNVAQAFATVRDLASEGET